AVLDETGKMHEISVIYPTAPRNDYKGSEKIVLEFIKKYNIELIAIDNGTASRESEQFIAEVIKNNNLDVHYIIVNEAGASVYSASVFVREEFPNLYVEDRSVVSIGRCVKDLLTYLVIIYPKSIDVRPYHL